MKFFISYKDNQEKTTKAFCESTWDSIHEERDIKIKLFQIYQVNENKKDNEILEKEPIDVVIKYIDLNDEKLNRKNLEQFDKDKQNNELKYSLRSIFKNIPWIRKIFIIMPNEKIDFLKNEEEIKEKIVYIKDSDLLGFDSSSPPAFQFNIHKLKQYNLSENFILMNDDYFIGQPLKKSDLFYEFKGKVYPYIISNKYYLINSEELKKDYMDGMNIIDEIKYNSKEGFEFRKTSTLLFLYKIFDDNYENNQLIEVEYTHNAIPLKLSDVEEIYNSIENDYKYSEYCLRGNKRTLHNLQPQILFTNYAKNKYNRFVNKISWKYYDLSDIDKVNLDSKLFVINREDKEYEDEVFKKEEKILEKLFPDKIKYEKDYIEIQPDIKENSETTKDNNIININKNNETEVSLDEKEKVKEEVNSKEKEKEEEVKKMKEEKEENKENKSVIDKKILEEKFNKLENEINNQKKEYNDKFNNILEKIKTIKNDIQKNSPYDTILSTKLQTLTESMKDLNEKIFTLDKESKNLKKAQNEFAEKALNKIVENNNNEKDNNSLKEIFDAIKEKNSKLEEKLNIISEINNSLTKKLNSMEENISDKEKDISKLTQENLELKSKITEFESQIESKNKNLEDLLEQNDEKINKLNNIINELKQNLEENKNENKQEPKIKEPKDKTRPKDSDDYSLSYIIVFIFVCVILFYAVYKIYYGKGADDSRKIKHMKLSSHSGYGSISSNSFM